MRTYRNRILTGFAIVFVIYAALLVLTNASDLLAHLRSYPWALFIPVIGLKAGAWFLRFWRWHYYLWVIGASQKISVGDSAILFVSGFAMVVSPGKLAELLKAVVLKVKTGVPVARSAPIVIAERVMDGVAVLAMLLLAYFLAGSAIDMGAYRLLVFLSGGLLVFGLVAVQIRPLAYIVLNLIHRLPMVKRLYHPLVDFYESSREIFHVRHVLPTGILGGVAHLLDALSFCIILSGFGLDITWTLYLQGVFITGLTAAIGALSGIPNGAGITEVTSSSMITAIIAPTHPGLTPAVALAAAMIEGFSHKWLRVLMGTVVAVVFRRRLFPPSVETALAEAETGPQRAHPVESEGMAA
ncbi:MAG: flippase-like domain-containing protein [Chloroflexi bacterium]|nr:flippase-like domain-containing protein [Chloroflexota bacterium]